MEVCYCENHFTLHIYICLEPNYQVIVPYSQKLMGVDLALPCHLPPPKKKKKKIVLFEILIFHKFYPNIFLAYTFNSVVP